MKGTYIYYEEGMLWTDYQINLDERLVSGDYFWGLTGTGGGGERDRYALGVEFNVPVTSWMTVTAAGRYDEYDDITNVSDANTYNVGLQIRPNDKILLRGTIATTFRSCSTPWPKPT